jgi:hypothetical protein
MTTDILRTVPTREAGYEALRGLTKPQLRQLCREEQIPAPSAASAQALRDSLVRILVGVRLDDGAISRHSAVN